MTEASNYVLNVTVGDMETGMWCDSCALPSGVRMEVLYSSPMCGVDDTRSLGYYGICMDCQTPL